RRHCGTGQRWVNEEERIASVISRTRRGTWSTPDDESLVRLADSTFQPGMLRKDLRATLTGFFDGRSAESIKKRLRFLHWSPPTSVNLVEACEAPPTVDSQHLPEMVDQSAIDQTQRLVSDITSGLASGPVRVGPWADLLEIITNWRDGVLNLQPARSALETLLAATFPHTWHSTPARTVRCVPTSKRGIRRLQYAHVQKLYATRRKDCAQTVLSGD
ncbi:hypothetical protein FGIG_12642, partial [Fasciola gigantica]